MNTWISEENELIAEAYNNLDNLLITGGGTDVCVIYFSGNNLYYPDNDETFKNTILEKNRFEWVKRKGDFDESLQVKEIFVRDVYKQWYVQGINSTLNSIDKLADYLKEETSDCKEVLTVGNSAGGYMAVLIGCLLHVNRVFTFSGQFDLHDRVDKNPLLSKYLDNSDKSKYYDLIGLVRNCDVPIYYFWPGFVEQDVFQAGLVSDLKNVKSFRFNQTIHGQSMYAENLPIVIGCSKADLDTLYVKYNGRTVSPFCFSVKISGFVPSLKGYCIMQLKRLYVQYKKIISQLRKGNI